MKHLCYKVFAFFRRFFFRLSVVLTLGIRDEKENNSTEDLPDMRDQEKGDYDEKGS